MPQCMVVDDTGAMHASATDPCVGVLALSPAEYTALNNSPLNLSAEDGFTLSVAILGVWAAAYFYRAVAKALNLGIGAEDGN